MKILPTRDLLFLCVGLVLLVILFVKSQAPDIEAHHEIQDSLLRLRQYEATLGMELLKQKGSMPIDGIPLDKTMEQMQATYARLLTLLEDVPGGISQETEDALDLYGSTLQAKEKVLEDFPEENARLNQSLRQLIHEAGLLRLSSRAHQVELQSRVDKLLMDVLQFNILRSDVLSHSISEHILALSAMTTEVSPELSEDIKSILKHAKMIQSGKFMVESLVSDLLRQPSFDHLNHIGKTYERLHKSALDAASNYQWPLAAGAVLLLAGLAQVMIRLRRIRHDLDLTAGTLQQERMNAAGIMKAKEDAEDSNRAKGEFLANMSHEIRTPMNGVIGIAETLRSSPLNKTQSVYVDTIITSAESLLDLLNDILDYSKIESGKLDVHPTPFELKEVVDQTVGILSTVAKDKGIELIFHIDDDCPEVVIGDQGRIRQVLTNLLGNAVKFTNEGWVKLRVMRDERSDPLTLKFEVADTGIGIAADQIDHIFEKFTQADASNTRKHGGSGLGLAISKRLVELMGGKIKARSLLGTGSVFTFTAPLGHATEVQTTDTQSQRVPTSILIPMGSHVLLAEDNAVNRLVGVTMLERLGCTVSLAANGREAVEMVAKEPFDLVLMDCQMPEMDGYEATREIRKRFPDREIPIVAITANAMAGDRERCLDAGMDDYISKPVKREALKSVLARWLTIERVSSP